MQLWLDMLMARRLVKNQGGRVKRGFKMENLGQRGKREEKGEVQGDSTPFDKMTQLDPFIQQLEQHINELKITHDSIGTSSDGQQQEVNSLLEDMLRVAHAKVTDAHNTRTSLQQSIVDVRTMTAKLKRLMGQYTTLDDTAAPGTLLDQHAEYTKEYAAVNTVCILFFKVTQHVQLALIGISKTTSRCARYTIKQQEI